MMNSRSRIQTKHAPVSGGLRNLSPKAMMMIVLLAVMGVLWGRVLLSGKTGPETASAEEAEQAALEQMMQSQQPAAVQVEMLELPEVPGRNDRLTCNFFCEENWDAFTFEGHSDVQVNSSEQTLERHQQVKLEQIVRRLVLEAVIEDAAGNPHQAFVEGKILSVGDTLTVQEGPDQYMLTVNQINEKEVMFSWNKSVVVLKMSETFDF